METPKRTLGIVFGALGFCAVIAVLVAGWSWYFVSEWSDPKLAARIIWDLSCNSVYDDNLQEKCTADWHAKVDPLRTNKWRIFDPALGTGTVLLSIFIVLFLRWFISPTQDICASTKWLSVWLSLTGTILVGIGLVANVAQEQSRNITPVWADVPSGAILFGAAFSVAISTIVMIPFMLITVFLGTSSSRILTAFGGRVRWQFVRLVTFLPALALVFLLIVGAVLYGNVYFGISATFMGFGLLDAQSHWAHHTHRKINQANSDLAQL